MLILLRVIEAFAYVLDYAITFLLVVIFARVVLSWIRIPHNQITNLIYQITEPILGPLRRRLPVKFGLDFSPMILLLILVVIRIIVVGGLFDYVAFHRRQYFPGI